MSHHLKTIPALDTTPTGRLPHTVIDPNAPVFGPDGEATPEGARALNRIADRLIREANRTSDPQATMRRMVEALPDAMAEAWANVQARSAAARVV
ncbi:hypothetical protein [Streptomyces sp. NPDC057838]|uniref:hypothetical protein n=1 Tax=unclassified Streptomyces TaxID=2593676 RepID=UPI0036A1F2F9